MVFCQLLQIKVQTPWRVVDDPPPAGPCLAVQTHLAPCCSPNNHHHRHQAPHTVPAISPTFCLIRLNFHSSPTK